MEIKSYRTSHQLAHPLLSPLYTVYLMLKGADRMRVLLISETQSDTEELATAILAAGHQLVGRSDLQGGYVYRLEGLAIELIILAVRVVKREMLKELHLLSMPVVIFADMQGDIDTDMVIQSGVGAYVVDGFKSKRVGAVIDLAQARFKQVEGLKLQLVKSRQELEERKEIDRAKGIIMKQKGCSEADAYQALRKAAMDQNRRIAEVARSIVSLAALLS